LVAGCFCEPIISEYGEVSLKPLAYVTAIESASWLLLLVAMVFKYGFGMAGGVMVMGRVHGFLFLAFVALLVLAAAQRKWSIGKTAFDFFATIVPFFGLVIARRILDEDEATSPAGADIQA
jgi:integral membrane protein